MPTPTIGYEDDTTLRRSDVARMQLEIAIELFVRAKFLPALTLAGAAEEILGKLVVRNGQVPVIKQSTAAILSIREKTVHSVMGHRSEREIIDTWNAARNAAKHLVNCEEESVTLNLCDEAYWMIRRALENARLLGIQLENENDFESWFITNVAT
jgi:hypothetical protein